jgi:hypothetical protein
MPGQVRKSEPTVEFDESARRERLLAAGAARICRAKSKHLELEVE